MHKLRLLILYPDPAGLALLTSMLKSLGHVIEEASNDRVAVRLMERNDIDLVLAGVDPSDNDALELLTYVRRKHREVPVVLLFPRLHPDRAKEALRLGAMAVLKYPVPAAELRAAVLQALEQCEARQPEATSTAVPPPLQPTTASSTAVNRLPQPIGPIPSSLPLHSGMTHAGLPSPQTGSIGATSPGGITLPATALSSSNRIDPITRELGLSGNDPSWRQVLDLAGILAPTMASVLIVGEPGTGKSLVARLLHALSPEANYPFVTLDTSTLSDGFSIHEGENLGQRTPESSSSPSLIWSQKLNQARGGTLYINELAGLPTELQHNLLRELQFRDFGATATHSQSLTEVRFLISTNENLSSLVEEGRLRQELFHRVSAVSLMLPPLRHRGTDIELLAESFRNRYAQEFHKGMAGFTRDALDVLQRHDWPGNVRELEAAIRRAVAMCSGPRISSTHLAPIINHHQTRGGTATPRPHLPMNGIRPLKEALEEPEKRIIIQALQAFNWNRQETARILNINRTTLYKKMKKYGLLIDEPAWAQ